VKLRGQALTLLLATALVPWFGWKLVQELEGFLRSAQEQALQASARTIARALPPEFQGQLRFGRNRVLPLRTLPAAPIIDGYQGDWPEPSAASRFSSSDGELMLEVLAGAYEGDLYLFCRVRENGRDQPVAADRDGPGEDGLLLFLRSPRGLDQYRVAGGAPGPLLVRSQETGGGQLEGYWQDSEEGYRVELALPRTGRWPDLSIGAVDLRRDPGRLPREAGTLERERPAGWLTPTARPAGLQRWLEDVVPTDARAWITDGDGWVVADTGPLARPPRIESSWAERFLYRAVAGERTDLATERPAQLVRPEDPLLTAALGGEEAQRWSQDPDNAVVRFAVATPLIIDAGTRGAVLLESRSDGLLLATNRALGRLLLTSLLLAALLAAGLWFFATRLSRRVQRLGEAVSAAMDDSANPGSLPLVEDRDELGELARNNERLLQAVAGYTGYLRKLAGRLSHELKTPLAITRSSLDNLSSRDLDPEAERFLGRAREGVERQAAIVRAMSEASRLEATVAAADWEVLDLGELLKGCAEAWRQLHPERDIRLDVSEQAIRSRVAPELLAQALDKLIDNALGLTGPPHWVELSLESKGNWRHIRVRNSGSRLPDSLREQLFDSLVSVRAPGDGGTHLGLGLYVVRLVVEAHGGTVRVDEFEENDASGVVFTLSLPAS
jgi:signal transduction histidine kinase